jgi:carbonic anhydrase
VVTQDGLRSLAISQRLLGTEEIVLVQHTGCGMLTFGDDELRRAIEADTGIRPTWAAETFTDVDQDVRQNLARIAADPSIPRKDRVRGFVYDVSDGSLREVLPAT